MARPRKPDPAAPYQPLRAAAELTGLSLYYIRNGVKAGTIPAIRMGRDWRVNMPIFLAQLETASKGGQA